MTDCLAQYGKVRSDNHRRGNNMLTFGNVKPSRQSNFIYDSLLACMCRLSREIGFTNENLKGFVMQKNIHLFAPLHSLVMSDEFLHDYHFEIPSMFSSIFVDKISGNESYLSDSRKLSAVFRGESGFSFGMLS